MKLKLISILTILLIASTLQQSTVFDYPQRAFIQKNGQTYYVPFGPSFSSEQDVVVTKISWSVIGAPRYSAYDMCVYAYRESDPPIPLVIASPSEIYCSGATRMGSAANWTKTLDLSSTPLYIKNGTQLFCATVGYAVSDASTLSFNCNLEYHVYTSGEAVYQVVRFPYVDQLMSYNSGAYRLNKAYYQTSIPRTVGGVAFYQMYLENYVTQNTTNICLRRISIEGGILTQSCTPNQFFTPNVNNDNPAVVYPINWALAAGEFLTAICQSTTPSDCALFAFVRIPDAEVLTDSAMSGGNLINRRFLDMYCDTYAPSFVHSYFGTDKVAACRALFP